MKRQLWINENKFIELSEPVKPDVSVLSDDLATRENSGEVWSQFFDALENPDPVLRKTGYTIEIFDEVKCDAQVSSCITGRRSGIQKLKWRIDKDNASDRAVNVITSAFKTFKMHTMYREILDALFYGYQVQEVIWGIKDSLIVPVKIEQKPSRWFSFDNNNNLIRLDGGFNQWTSAEEKKFLLAQNNATYDNPFGEGLGSMCFWPVTFKKGGIKFWAKFLEKFSIPHVVGKLPAGASHIQRRDLLTALSQMVQDAVAVIPDNATIKFVEAASKSSSSDLFERFEKYHDAEISKIVLGHSSAADATPGRLGGEDVGLTVRDDLIDSDRMLVTETMNELIGWILSLNPSLGTEQPLFVLYEKEKIDNTLAERDSTISKSGKVVFTKKYYQKAYGFADEDIVVDETTGRSDVAMFSDPVSTSVTAEDAIQQLGSSITDNNLQSEMEKILKPVFELRDNAASFAEFQQGLLKLFPDMDASGVETMLEKSGLLASVWGRLNADKA